jgi:hypothetical protein
MHVQCPSSAVRGTYPVIWGTPPGIIWLVKASSDDGASAPEEVPEDINQRVRTLCLGLPEVTVRVDFSLTSRRSTV